MKHSLTLLIICLELLLSYNSIQAQRIGVYTGFGVIGTKKLDHRITYGTNQIYHAYENSTLLGFILGLNCYSAKNFMYSFRLSSGEWTNDEPDRWSILEISVLAGLKKETKWIKVFGLVGPGYVQHHYWSSWESGYDYKKVGLSYEMCITLIPASIFGLGFKYNGHITTGEWSSQGAFVVLEFGKLRKY